MANSSAVQLSTNTKIDGDKLNFDKNNLAAINPSVQPEKENNNVNSQSYSSAATKIVTSAIFAPVPGQIDDKAKYVIAIADFNGYIRIFSKY